MNDFEKALEQCFWFRLMNEERGGEFGARLWGSLSNVEWKHQDGDTFACTFRYAGGLISRIARKGNYMSWYCSGDFGVIDEEVANALGKFGWKPALL